MREARQRPLALEREQPFGLQASLQPLELALQGADTGLLQVLGDQLVLALGLVDADAAAHQHLGTGPRREAYERVLGAEHGAAQLRLAVLEGEVPVSGRRLRE